MESVIKHRGRARIVQKIRQAGIDADIADEAIREVFQEVDESELLDRAFERKMRGKTVKDLDDKGRARIVRALVGQGFPFDAVLKRLKK
jgi:SOS response regulatory protein OraA/RecX